MPTNSAPRVALPSPSGKSSARSRAAPRHALEQGLALERELQQRLFASPEAKEGLAAFTQKRDPVFRQR